MSKQAVAPAPVEDDEDDVTVADESREDRFKRVGKRRVNRIIREFDLLDNLASSNYAFSEAQVEKLIHTLEARVVQLHDRFAAVLRRETKQRPTFDFDD